MQNNKELEFFKKFVYTKEGWTSYIKVGKKKDSELVKDKLDEIFQDFKTAMSNKLEEDKAVESERDTLIKEQLGLSDFDL